MADSLFLEREHQFCGNNCGHHVSQALNNMKYRGKDNYNDVYVMAWFALQGRYVSWCHLLKMYLPLLLVGGVIAAIVLISFYS